MSCDHVCWSWLQYVLSCSVYASKNKAKPSQMAGVSCKSPYAVQYTKVIQSLKSNELINDPSVKHQRRDERSIFGNLPNYMTMDKQAADDVQKIDSMDSEWTKYWILLYKTQLCPFIHHLPAQILTLETGHIEKKPSILRGQIYLLTMDKNASNV